VGQLSRPAPSLSSGHEVTVYGVRLCVCQELDELLSTMSSCSLRVSLSDFGLLVDDLEDDDAAYIKDEPRCTAATDVIDAPLTAPRTADDIIICSL